MTIFSTGNDECPWESREMLDDDLCESCEQAESCKSIGICLKAAEKEEGD